MGICPIASKVRHVTLATPSLGSFIVPYVVLPMIQVRYRKSPRDTVLQNLKLTLTLVLTLTDTGGAVLTLMLGYRRLYITWQ